MVYLSFPQKFYIIVLYKQDHHHFGLNVGVFDCLFGKTCTCQITNGTGTDPRVPLILDAGIKMM